MTTEDIQPSGGSGGRAFDFAAHRRRAVDEYEPVRELFTECAEAVRSVLKTALEVEEIQAQSIESRGKSVESFGEKCERPNEKEPNRPKYPEPLNGITDLSGVRVIVFLHNKIDEVSALIKREFDVIEEELVAEASGYRGIHFLVTFSDKRTPLPEYRRFTGHVTEIQVRTVLQHAWAEVEHGIVYKAKVPVPTQVRERLVDLAGALRVADRELQGVSSHNVADPVSEPIESPPT